MWAAQLEHFDRIAAEHRFERAVENRTTNLFRIAQTSTNRIILPKVPRYSMKINQHVLFE